MKKKIIGTLAILGTVILVGCSGSTDNSSNDSSSSGGTFNYTDTISAQKIQDPGYGYDIFFQIDYDNKGDLDGGSSVIIMADGGASEIKVGKHTNGRGTGGLICDKLGGNPSTPTVTDEYASYVCSGYFTHGYDDLQGMILEKGKAYSFFLRYFDRDGVLVEESEIAAVLEYGDEVLSIQQ